MTKATDLIKGCNTSSTKDGSCFAREKGDLCDNCISFAKGLLTAYKDEIQYLKEWLEAYSDGDFRRTVCEEDIADRIQHLESEIKILNEGLK